MAEKKKVQVQPLALIGDEPVGTLDHDRLSLRNFAETVAGVSLGTEGPFTIGVFGGWGHGKTSLLRLSQRMVDEQEKDNVTTAWFNAWQYENEPHPIVPLVATIIRALEKDQATRPGASIRKGSADLIRALRAVAYGFSAKTKLSIPGVAEVEAGFVAREMIDREEKLKGQSVDPLLDQSLYYNAFQLLGRLRGDEDAEPAERLKIVVFVDDLDRCFPENAVHLLESIKLVLAQPGFVFVLAVDQHVIHAYLDKRYRDDFGLHKYAHGQSYLDKIIQLPFAIPTHEDRFESFIARMLERDELNDLTDDFEPLQGIIGPACNYNPREVVRFFNGILIDKFIWDRVPKAEDEEKNFDAGAFAVARSLKNQSDPIYRVMLRDDWFCEALTAGNGPVTDRLYRLRASSPAVRREGGMAEGVGIDAEARKEGDQAREPGSLIPAWSSDHDKAVDELLNREHLCKLLDSVPGQRWLRSAELRRSIEQFIAVQRTEKEDPHHDEEGAVPRAVLGAIERADAAERTVDTGSDDYWCRILDGTFRMGAQLGSSGEPNYDKDATDRESPVHDVRLDSYSIARNPVTVGEFRQFLDAGGYKEEDHWTAGGFKSFKQPEDWVEQLEHANRPVVGVSWYEAAAYTAWAHVRLPTEGEWEYAARGAKGRRYPWGNETPNASRANYNRVISNPTPVGVYPRGATPEGVLDMAGNVWEWCADVWHSGYKGAPSDGSAWMIGGERDLRVFRGGSWTDAPGGVRSANRSGGIPGTRYGTLGFRLAQDID